jgi:alpha,alpha-trehalase
VNVRPGDVGRPPLFVAELHLDLARIANDVIVSDDPVVDDEPGSQPIRCRLVAEDGNEDDGVDRLLVDVGVRSVVLIRVVGSSDPSRRGRTAREAASNGGPARDPKRSSARDLSGHEASHPEESNKALTGSRARPTPDTGAIPAAATTSIPEKIGSDRTWDYRYNWIRDAKFTVQALHDTGHRGEAREYFRWFMDVVQCDPAEIQPVYGLHGETDLDERVLEHLSGYRNTRPVRIGNGAAPQWQLDAYGTIVQAAYETIQADEETSLTDDEWTALCTQIDYVCDHWDEPDAGIWEFRDESRHFLHSKLLCWVALDRGIEMANDEGFDAPLERWREEREAVREAIEERGYSEAAGSFVQHFESDEAIDATALLIPIYEFLPSEDERVQNTIDTVLEKLTTDNGLVVRFVDTDIREDETEAFVLCSFWLIDALVLSNRLERAEEYFETVLEHASPLGLYSEKLDPDDGTLLGNFPQAFSHLGLLNSVSYLTRALEIDGDVAPEDLHADGVDTLFERGETPESATEQ